MATVNELVADAFAIVNATEKVEPPLLDLDKLHSFAVSLNDLSTKLHDAAPRSSVLPDPLADIVLAAS